MNPSARNEAGNNSTESSSDQPVALVLADFMFGARVQAALAQLGWTPRMAGTPESALENLRQSRPQVALVELGAGNPARIEFIRNLRTRPEGEGLPILAFGSHKARAMLEEARDAGATMVVSNGTLVSRFQEVLQKSLDATLPEDERFLTEDDE